MNRTALTLSLVVLGIAALLAYLTLFTVSQTQQALLTRIRPAQARHHRAGSAI